MKKIAEITNNLINNIKDYYDKNNAKGAIIGLSGGKDSSVVASILVKALGKENVIGLWLPCLSSEEDKKDAYEVAKTLGIRIIEHDLEQVYEEIVLNVIKNENIQDNKLLLNANINLKPRLRTNILYYYAAYFTALHNKLYLVCGTSNKSERYVGYYTKGGDNVCDIAPIRELYVDEVISVGEYLGIIPKHILYKTPNDGLSGMSDEEKLGFTYSDVKKVSEEDETKIKDDTIDEDIRKKILLMHQRNLHKEIIPDLIGDK